MSSIFEHIDNIHVSDFVEIEKLAFSGNETRKRCSELNPKWYFFAYFEITEAPQEFWYKDLLGYRFLGLCFRYRDKENIYKGYKNKDIICSKDIKVFRRSGRKFYQTGRGFFAEHLTLI